MAVFAVSVWSSNRYILDPKRVFATSDEAHKSKVEGERAIVSMFSRSQLVLELSLLGYKFEIKDFHFPDEGS